jgi:hypothetical protein
MPPPNHAAHPQSQFPPSYGAAPGGPFGHPPNVRVGAPSYAPPPHASPPQAAPSFPSHFAPPVHGAPLATARSGVMPPHARSSLAPPAEAIPMGPIEPRAIMAASVFLGLPLFLATLVVAVLAMR